MSARIAAALAANPTAYPLPFLAWLADNGHVYEAFEAEALRVIAKGFKHYSARTIVHVLRHHSAVAEVGGAWKINDHHSPYLARLFSAIHPEHAGLWEYRRTQGQEAA